MADYCKGKTVFWLCPENWDVLTNCHENLTGSKFPAAPGPHKVLAVVVDEVWRVHGPKVEIFKANGYRGGN